MQISEEFKVRSARNRFLKDVSDLKKSFTMSIPIEKVIGPEADKFYSDCNKIEFPEGFSRIGIYGTIYPTHQVHTFNEIFDFMVRPDDVFINGFPKSGTTWLQELVWLLGNNLDFEKAKKVPTFNRIPFIGTYKNRDEPCTNDFFETMESPRFIKIHLPYNLLPNEFHSKKPKLIHITRGVKDVVVSYFHHCVAYHAYSGTFERFCDAFMSGNIRHTPYWDFVSSYYEVCNEPNILILTYEEMQKDIVSVIKKIAKFLGKNQPSDQEVQLLKDYLSFNSMKSNPAVNMEAAKKHYGNKFGRPVETDFIRKGKINSWKEEMPEHIAKKFDDWINSNKTN